MAFDKFRTSVFNNVDYVAIYGFKLIGHATMSIATKQCWSNDDRRYCREFGYSRIGIVYNLMLFVLVVPVTMYQSVIRSEKIIEASMLLRALNHTSRFTTTVVCAYFIMFHCVKQRTLIELANRIFDNEANVKRLGCKYRRGPFLRYIAVVLIIHAGLWINLVIVFTRIVSFLRVFTLIVPNFITNSLLMQYLCFVRLIQEMVGSINAELLKIIEIKDNSSVQLIVNNLEGIRKSNQATKIRLSALRDSHSSLSLLSKDVSNFYSIVSLLCVSRIFVMLLLTGYFLIVPLVTEQAIPVLLQIFSCMWIISEVYTLIIFTRCVTETTEKISQTGVIVHLLMRKFRNDDEIINELKEFSMYVLHTNVKFSALEYFPLDDTLIKVILSTVTSYAVIIIQFKG